jgi:hypothetical protein
MVSMRKRTALLGGAAVLAATAAWVGISPAQADVPTCTYSVTLSQHIVLNAPSSDDVKPSDPVPGCPIPIWKYQWNGQDVSGGSNDDAEWSNMPGLLGPGTYQAVGREYDQQESSYGESGWQPAAHVVLQPSSGQARFGSTAAMPRLVLLPTTTRVTLRATVTAYSPMSRAFEPWAGRTVSFQRQKADGTWETIRQIAADRAGHAAATVDAEAGQSWRSVTADDWATWGSESKTVQAKRAERFAWAGATRSGSYVTLKAKAWRYSTTWQEWLPKKGAGVQFQVRDAAGRWKTMKTVATTADGIAKATFQTSKRTWRAIRVETPTVWSATTRPHAG